ncbi:MAG: DUF4255 domain-containing protein [Candidatus Eremiobacteraeota bacterium]|nr:DUF4255 domain-containing protein [Candidatus Eremiobacteraeota bacterium]
MSNYLAVATVTATLQAILAEAASVVHGARVVIDRPRKDEDAVSAPHINVALYQILPHGAWRALDAREQVALDLHYLLTFHGDESRCEPQLLLGSAVSRLHDEAVLTPERVRAVEERAQFLNVGVPMTSNLALQDDPVTFAPLPLTLDDLSKIWSSFFQLPSALAVAYQAGVVLIDHEETRVEPLAAAS